MSAASSANTVLVCPDKFRGSATASEAAHALGDGLVSGGADVRALPVADGGEGTIDACLAAGFTEHHCSVRGPLGRTVAARFATRGRLAVIEAAQACGHLGRVPDAASAVSSSTYGVGQLIREALDAGCAELIIGVGGTASTDGGAGMLDALGAEFRRADGTPVRPGGVGLQSVATVQLDSLEPRLRSCTLHAATDVNNVLLGEHGAAHVFGPQKGATRDVVRRLDRGLSALARVVDASTGAPLSHQPGSGAGGGLGYGLLVAGAACVSGAETLLDLAGFDDAAKHARLVITGEGCLDESSLGGKAPIAVLRRAARLGRPVVAVVGRTTLDAERLAELGFARVHELAALCESPDTSIQAARTLLRRVGRSIAAGLDRAAGGERGIVQVQ